MAARDDNLSTRINSSVRAEKASRRRIRTELCAGKGFYYLRGLPVRWTIIVRTPARFIRSSFHRGIQNQCRIPRIVSIADNSSAPPIQEDVDAAAGAEAVMEPEFEALDEKVSVRIRLQRRPERTLQKP